MHRLRSLEFGLLSLVLPAIVTAQQSATKPRARDLGVPFDGAPGALNAITDVTGIEVGHATIISRDGAHAARTGVTVVLPRGRKWEPVFAGYFAGNGFGDLVGTAWVQEGGVLGGPVAITNTYSVGTVRDAVLQWFEEDLKVDIPWHQPVVGETSDGFLNDIAGFHVKKEHVFAALNGARPGPVPEGSVGGGTGMVAHGFKAGIGTSSRRLDGGYTLGVLVQANYGSRELLTIAGVPVGREITDLQRVRGSAGAVGPTGEREGSIIVVVATDAPLLPHQLERLARRVPMGIARLGGTAANGSGDIFIAFSTANPGAAKTSGGPVDLRMLPNGDLSGFFLATIQATEEAIVNALVAAEAMTGANGNKVYALPHDRLREALRKYNRLDRR
ncbi:MAG: P1 family peptidase [Gemmatimonadetes bacterium]|nr:P1 family peptidase [Gemmatimonadota bacterium]